MANNLFVSYDLYSPGQNYDSVAKAIKSLGSWAKVQKSLWYVKSSKTASEAVDTVWAVMDANDSIIVVDATNQAVSWQNLNDEVADHLRRKWNE